MNRFRLGFLALLIVIIGALAQTAYTIAPLQLKTLTQNFVFGFLEVPQNQAVQNSPFTVKLKFEPSNRQRSRASGEEDKDDEFYVANRENKCVVCGSTKDYARFFIIPSLYRTHLPDGLKSHRSHDIVLMCFGCHDLASRR